MDAPRRRIRLWSLVTGLVTVAGALCLLRSFSSDASAPGGMAGSGVASRSSPPRYALRTRERLIDHAGWRRAAERGRVDDASASDAPAATTSMPDLEAAFEAALRTRTADDLQSALRAAISPTRRGAVPPRRVAALMCAVPNEESGEGKRAWQHARVALVRTLISEWTAPEACAFLRDAAVRDVGTSRGVARFAERVARQCGSYRPDDELVVALLRHPESGFRDAGRVLAGQLADEFFARVLAQSAVIDDASARASLLRTLADAVAQRPLLPERVQIAAYLSETALHDPDYGCRVAAIQSMRELVGAVGVGRETAVELARDASLEWPERVTAWELSILTRTVDDVLGGSARLDDVSVGLHALDVLDWESHSDECLVALRALLREPSPIAAEDSDLVALLLFRSTEFDRGALVEALAVTAGIASPLREVVDTVRARAARR